VIELLRRFGFRPRTCVWELTLACNMRCLHCGSIAGSPRHDELSPDAMLSVADQLVELRCERVTLGGGEPTLHPRWDEVARRLSDGGVKVSLISNAWTWTSDHLTRARNAGMSNVAFSLDGLEEAHDRVRLPGSFARVLRAIDESVAAGFTVPVVTHLNRINARRLAELGALVRDHGVPLWQVQLGIPTGTLRANRDVVLEPTDLLWLVPALAGLRASLRPAVDLRVADNIGYFGRHEKAIRDRGKEIAFWLGCRAGMQVIGIESNGNVKGCLSLPSERHGDDRFIEGSLRDHPLSDLWARPGAFAWNRSFDETRLGGFCAVCRYRDICRGGCACTAHCATGFRSDNPYCFYRQAVSHGRLDLLDDDVPSDAELQAAGHPEPCVP
jgi:radical SAM protein with 4Fe4S-binding SPASM domain